MARIFQFTRLLLLAALIGSCTAAPATILAPTRASSAQSEWPTLSWRTAAPQDTGVDPNALARVVEKAQKMNLHSLLVIRDGYLISENYYAGNDASTQHELYSVTKSFTSTLVGIAVDQGVIATIDAPVMDFFPSLELTDSAEKSTLTLKHILTMSSGLDWQEGDPVYRAMYMSSDRVEYVLSTPRRVDPGAEFNYCSGCSHVLSAALQAAAKTNTREFADANLFKPLGISNYAWDVDSQGIPIGGWGLKLTPRDMAKLGYLYLHRGVWDGKQILSADWIKAATRTQITTGGSWGYGYQWWIDEVHDAYAARGRYGQLIYVVPGLDLIVVSTAAAESDEPLIDLVQMELFPTIAETKN